MKVFISQPMRYRTEEEILSERKQIQNFLQKYMSEEVVILDTYMREDCDNPLSCLIRSLSYLNDADLVVFAPDWERARGCRIEYQCCKEYHKRILEL